MSFMQVHLIYASTSGNVEFTMETIAALLQNNGWDVQLARSEQVDLTLLSQKQSFVFGTSTWEHGKLNPFFEPVYKKISELDCNGKKAAFVGLGDRRYEPVLFCEGMLQVRKLWLEQGGSEVGVPLKIGGEPYHQVETAITPWAEQLLSVWKVYST